jgi:SAM-dependent methyltransferase
MQPANDSPDACERFSGEWLTQHADLFQPGLRVLDLGCGPGDDTAQLTALGLWVVALDRDRPSLLRARVAAPEAHVVQADIAGGLPFKPGAFDVVVASLSLHYFHWETTRRIVAEVGALIRPGGRLLCRVNRVGDVHFDYGVGPELEPELFEVRPGHLKRFFSEETLAALLTENFEIEALWPETTTRWEQPKRTLVARARPKG